MVRQLFETRAVGDASVLRGAAATAYALFEPRERADDGLGDDPSFALLHALYWLTVNLAGDGPLVFAVDDLHLCDGPSQMMTRPSLLFSDGLPLVFDRFDLTGTTPPLTDELFAAINAGQPIPIDPTGAGPRRRELPLGRQAMRFPGG